MSCFILKRALYSKKVPRTNGSAVKRQQNSCVQDDLRVQAQQFPLFPFLSWCLHCSPCAHCGLGASKISPQFPTTPCLNYSHCFLFFPVVLLLQAWGTGMWHLLALPARGALQGSLPQALAGLVNGLRDLSLRTTQASLNSGRKCVICCLFYE